MKLHRLLIAFALLVLVLTAQGAGAEIVNGIAAKVAGDIITIHEFNRALEQSRFTAELLGAEPPEKVVVMNELINNRLLMDEAQRRGIVVTDRELEEAIEAVKKKHDLDDQEFERKLQQDKMTIRELKENYRVEIIRARLINQMSAASYQGVAAEEITAFYRDPENRHLFTVPALVELAQIFLQVPPESTYQEAVSIKEKARSMYQQLEEGASFEQLALEHSQAPNSTERGYLGSFTREQLQMFMSAQDIAFLFSLGPNEISPPIRLADGYYIFKVLSRKEETVLELEEAREQIRSYLLREKGRKLYQDWLQETRASTSIQIVLSME